MRKALFIVAMILTIASLAACQKTEQAAVSLAGKKLLYVEKASSGGDFLTVSRIKKMGFEVTEMFDGDFTAESAEGFDLVFVSSSISSGKVGSKLYNSPVPVVYAEPQNISDIDMAGWDDTVDNGTVPGKSITIANPDHPIAAGFSGSVDVYKSEGAIGIASRGDGGGRRAESGHFHRGEGRQKFEQPSGAGAPSVHLSRSGQRRVSHGRRLEASRSGPRLGRIGKMR